MMLGGINPCIPQLFLDDLMLSVETSPRCSVVFLVATVGKYIREYVCVYIYTIRSSTWNMWVVIVLGSLDCIDL